ncbi:MAG: type IV pili twitching motility protein PilT, partial [Myxococcales bacterium]|nr:type IV pili twitching motility protein PilT [Myxococcales bacterium]
MAQIDRLFDVLLDRGGSDLHLSVGYPPMIRSKGDLVRISQTPIGKELMEQLLGEICDPERFKTFQETGDLDFAYAYGNKARFRANYLRKTTGAGAVFRTIPSKIL